MLGCPNIEGEDIGGVGNVMDLTKTWTIHLRERERGNESNSICFRNVFSHNFPSLKASGSWMARLIVDRLSSSSTQIVSSSVNVIN